jgi:lysophospholipase L1-like esterase
MNMQVRRFSLVITVLVVIMATILGVSVSRAATAPIKIMPVGDSVTAGIGSTGNGSYRTDLYKYYTNAGISFDFVGSQSGGPSSLPDKDNEGHSGWVISQIASNVNNWLNTYNPDVMLLMIGGNDTLAGTVPTSALSSLIDQITNLKPNLTLFVADYYYSLPSNANYNLIVQYDAAIPGIVQQKANAGKHVYFVKLSDAQFATSEYADGLHPTDSGYSKLATIWYNSTISILRSMGTGTPGVPTNTPTRTPTSVAITATPTRTPTIGASLTPGGPTPTRTNTPNSSTPTPIRTATPGSGATCSPVSSTITAPFSFDGVGTFCWQSSNLGSYINSWNTTSVTLNGVNVSNLYVAVGSYPAKVNGYWYVSYSSSVAWGHFEAK